MIRYHRFVNIILLVLVGIILSAGTSLSDVNCELITNQNTYWPTPDLSQPEYLETVTDPSFGTKITRIVGDPGTPLPNVPGQVWASEQLRHGYSKRQVWNSDQSMIFLDRHVPNIMYYLISAEGECHLGKWDVVNDVATELIDLRSYTKCSFGQGEGNFSAEGDKVADIEVTTL
ncbi:MAG TPA: hypothetical protein ENI20_11555, partial [Bacteroides sp.]|nr:hypothetical protein [Bacteroides sp.]